jgi:hypothetical protein
MNDLPVKMYDTITYYMVKASKFKDKKGNEKKVFVLNSLKEILDPSVYSLYFELISDFIDFLIKIAKNKKVLETFKAKSQGVFSICLE